MKTTISPIESNLFAQEAATIPSATKLGYAIKSVFDDFNKTGGLNAMYNKDIRRARINKASVDEKGNILNEVTEVNGQQVEKFKFTPANLILLEEEIEGLANKQYTFEAYECQDIPELTDGQIKAFEGIVIPIGYKNPIKENSVHDSTGREEDFEEMRRNNGKEVELFPSVD